MDVKNIFQLPTESLNQIDEMLNSNVEVTTTQASSTVDMNKCTSCWGGSCASGITG